VKFEPCDFPTDKEFLKRNPRESARRGHHTDHIIAQKKNRMILGDAGKRAVVELKSESYVLLDASDLANLS
jgi:hypothetical protein